METTAMTYLQLSPPPMRTPWYFAYGSNLCQTQMKRRSPRAIPYANVYLPGYQLLFRYFADVVKTRDPKRRVAGGLYKITPACELELDKQEGYKRDDPTGGAYRKEYATITVPAQDGGTVDIEVMFYVMNKKGITMPPEWYKSIIRQGYRDFGIDPKHLSRALDRTRKRSYETPAILKRQEMAAKRAGVAYPYATITTTGNRYANTTVINKDNWKSVREKARQAELAARPRHQVQTAEEIKKRAIELANQRRHHEWDFIPQGWDTDVDQDYDGSNHRKSEWSPFSQLHRMWKERHGS